MTLENILSVTGKPGLYKLKTKARSGFVVESLLDKKTSIIGVNQNVSVLKDIAIYTYATEVPLKDIFQKIAVKEAHGPALSHKASSKELTDYFLQILPDFDQERVYASDIKKVLQWYNLLQEHNLLDQQTDEEE